VVKDTNTPAYSIQRTIGADGNVTSESRLEAGKTERPIASYLWDRLGRRTQVTPADASASPTVTTYDLENGARTDTARGASGTSQWVDGFGRVVKTQNSEGVIVETSYDELGRKAGATLPYVPCSSCSPPVGAQWTSFAYDALDRILTKTNPGGSAVHYGHAGLDVTITDENGNPVHQTWSAVGHPSQARLEQ
jgi:YD repeat-containing protein